MNGFLSIANRGDVLSIFPVAQQVVGVSTIVMQTIYLIRAVRNKIDVHRINAVLNKSTNDSVESNLNKLPKRMIHQMRPALVEDLGTNRDSTLDNARTLAITLNTRANHFAIISLKGMGIGLARTLPVIGTIYSLVAIHKANRQFQELE